METLIVVPDKGQNRKNYKRRKCVILSDSSRESENKYTSTSYPIIQYLKKNKVYSKFSTSPLHSAVSILQYNESEGKYIVGSSAGLGAKPFSRKSFSLVINGQDD